MAYFGQYAAGVLVPFCSNFRKFLKAILSGAVYASPVEGAPRGQTDMRTLLQRFLRNESGATAIEYGLIAAGISVAIITVVNGLGTKLSGTFTNINSKLN